MKKYFGLLGAVCFLIGGAGFTVPTAATAQDQSGVHQPPPVLVINREFMKPGSVGDPHVKAESAIAQALAQANSPDHDLAAVAITGKERVLFFHGFDSYAGWQKAVAADMHNSQLAQSLPGDTQADNDLLASKDTGVFEFQPDLSVSPAVDVPRMRFLEITGIQVKLGHEADFAKLAKVYDSIFSQVPNAHWAMYQLVYDGNHSGVYLAFHFMKSMADVDQDHRDSAKAFAAASAEQKQQMNYLEKACCKSIASSLFALDPDMSYVGDKWKTEDPGFWKQ